MSNPKRGEIWTIDFDPTKGSEVKKVRPAVVISSDRLGVLPVKLVVPFTDWKQNFSGKVWMVKVDKSSSNGLTKTSTADALQARAVSLERFVKPIGKLESDVLEQVVASLAILIEYS